MIAVERDFKGNTLLKEDLISLFRLIVATLPFVLINSSPLKVNDFVPNWKGLLLGQGNQKLGNHISQISLPLG